MPINCNPQQIRNLKKRKRINKPRGSIDKPRGAAADKWTDDETSILINVLHDDARKHGFSGSTLSGPRWTEINDEFLMKIRNVDRFDDEQIKSKVGRLKRETKTFKELLNSCSGYGWDPITNTVTCPSDTWANHVNQKKEKNVYISKYRYQGLKDFDLLDEIFGNSFATENHVMYSTNPNFSGIWFVIMIMNVIDEGSVYTRYQVCLFGTVGYF
ncbi:uncharacterized protein [Nicotiana sylvestris]|uniref:Uncharacterized protein isoform X2 n=2 Tax=Nicotiana TaxID=4085 RepID=A0A1S3YH45_TOBAC|nr:PREDICTED: uncharacterized protein LOC104237980 isoform X2 [Nicotiana sylvestris]XP_016451358.1 PREDICTED: uncharacterized protein LOC107776064 isoform X2 [Nicotiana tabacum]